MKNLSGFNFFTIDRFTLTVDRVALLMDAARSIHIGTNGFALTTDSAFALTTDSAALSIDSNHSESLNSVYSATVLL